VAGARTCACGCGRALPRDATSRRRYYDDVHRDRAKKRRYRREHRDPSKDLRIDAKPVDGRVLAFKGREESEDGRASARRGAGYEAFRRTPWPGLIADGTVTNGEVATELGTTGANVSRWMAAYVEDLAAEAAMADWTRSDEVERALLAYEPFTRRFHPDALIPDFHLEWEEEIDGVVGNGGRLALLAPQRHGKLLADSTPVLTPDGWRTHGDLKVGDRVYAPDGSATTVIGVKPKDVASVEVEFSDGQVIKCHPEHLWTVYDRGLRRYVTRETRQLTGRVIMQGRRNLLVDWTEPLQAPEADLPIDPYLLGAWLGDGQSDSATICGEPTDLAAIELELKVRGFEPSRRWTHPTTGVGYIGFRVAERVGRGAPNVWRELGLYADKHVPDVYYTGSERQRRDLLAGLVDTDGSVDTDGRVRFTTVSPRLRDDVVKLVATFGYHPCVTEVEPDPAPDAAIQGRRTVYVVAWTPHDGRMQGWAIDRKRTVRRGPVRHDRRTIVDIRPAAEPEPGHCIAVDHASQLYLAGDRLVPTHNTEFLIRYCQRRIAADPDICILWVSRAKELAEESVGMLRQLLEDEQFCAAVLGPGEEFKPQARSGKSWTDEKFTVAQRTRVRKSPTVRALGIGGTTSGRDADLIIVDDPQEREDCVSPTTREKQARWFFTTLLARKMEHTGLALITSRRHIDDIPGKIAKDHAGDWRMVTYRAHKLGCPKPDENSERHDDCVLWPELRSHRFLMGQKRADVAFFECNYQNNPTADSLVLIKAEDLERCKDRGRRIGQAPKGATRLIAGIDPAEAKPVAAVLWAWCPDGSMHVVDTMEADPGIRGGRQIVTGWHQKYGCREFVVETNMAQSWWQDRELRDYCSRNGIPTVREHYTSRMNKMDPSHGVPKMFNDMRTQPPKVTFPYADRETRDKIDRLLETYLLFDPDYAGNKHADDDLPMASWFGHHVMQGWTSQVIDTAKVDYHQTVWTSSWGTRYPSVTRGATLEEVPA